MTAGIGISAAPFPTDSCGSEGYALVFEARDWVMQGGQTRISLGETGTSAAKSSSKIRTTTSTTYGGQVELGPTTGTGHVSRRLWISNCPGGPAIDADLATSHCDLWGTEVFLKWKQGEYPGRCELARDMVYYINYENMNCDAYSCDAYRNLRNNSEP